ncbi:MAG TPA: hypothetical protein PLK54_08075, partial [Ferruginibacter sp.]|nr:hypothetical protein [Ferruginibacter sp.]
AGQNPPDGAIIDYYLAKDASSVQLEILDSKGNIIRRYTSADTLYTIPKNNVPPYWIRPQQLLSTRAGSHRFTWDMHYQPLNLPATYPISAIYMNTAPDPTSPWVLPGTYKAWLTVDGKLYQQTFTVTMDPRVKTGINELTTQHDLSLLCYNHMKQCIDALKETETTGETAAELRKELNSSLRNFGSIQNILQDSDLPPTTQAIAAAREAEKAFAVTWKKYMSLKK